MDKVNPKPKPVSVLVRQPSLHPLSSHCQRREQRSRIIVIRSIIHAP